MPFSLNFKTKINIKGSTNKQDLISHSNNSIIYDINNLDLEPEPQCANFIKDINRNNDCVHLNKLFWNGLN